VRVWELPFADLFLVFAGITAEVEDERMGYAGGECVVWLVISVVELLGTCSGVPEWKWRADGEGGDAASDGKEMRGDVIGLSIFGAVS
jgi:hypothetical protein